MEKMILIVTTIFLNISVNSQTIDLQELKSFPSAEGYGKYTCVNQPERIVYFVTNLNDNGPGSLRDGVSQGNRTIVFQVAGTITLLSNIQINSGNIYVAGQTAFQNGGQGITLKSDGNQYDDLITVFADHVVFRFIRFRRGPDGVGGSVSGDNIDFLNADYWILDHCSLSWSTDENLAAGNSSKGTMQYCISSEGLYFSTHWYSVDPNSSSYQTGHSKGSIFGWGSAPVDSLTFYKNYFAHNDGRNPRIYASGATFEIVNNVMYNNRYFNIEVGSDGTDTIRTNIVKNLLIPGPDTRLERYMVHSVDNAYHGIYMNNNIGFHRKNNYQDDWMEVGQYATPIGQSGRSYSPFDSPMKDIFPLLPPAYQLDDIVLSDVGASLAWDYVDLRVLADAENLTPTEEKTITGMDPAHWNGASSYFGIINDPSEVGGWPDLAPMTTIAPDSNLDGVDDTWASTHGVTAWDDVIPMYTFGNITVNNLAGYTARAIYLSYLAEDFKRLLPVEIEADGENCADARVISGTGQYHTDGPSNGFGCHNCDAANHADWWKFKAPSDGSINVKSCLGGSDTRLWIYQGDCGNLVQIGKSDDDCFMNVEGDNFASELINISVIEGADYFIEWDNKWAIDSFVFSFQFVADIVDLDGDGFTSEEDCDDTNPDVNPNQVEIVYNGLDDDCNSSTPDDDLDQDGFLIADDCDDNNPNINPDQTEEPYNGIDDDCNNITPDDDLDQDGFLIVDDCDDNNSNINPNQAEEPYNGIDDDCNSATLDDDLDQDGFLFVDDCDDNNPNINPDQTEEPYNGVDDDCNDATLDDDLDQDGFLLADDCDDNNPNINPDAEEIANNGIDEDCDGMDLVSSTYEIGNSTINIFPNPTIDEINLSITGNLSFKTNLFDLNGKLLISKENSNKINVTKLPSGTYLLEIKDQKTGQKIVEKVIIGE